MKTKNYCFLLLFFICPLLLKSQFLAADINKSAVGSDPAFVRAGANYLVFTASNTQYGREIFINKGTVSRPQLVKDLNPGTGSSEFWDITLIDTSCYFVTSLGAQTINFWRFSINNLNPVLLRSLPVSGIGSGQNGRFIKLADQVYFLHRNVNSRMELWKTDGTSGGTNRVFEFGQNVIPNKLEVYNNQLVFLAEDNAGRSQIWKSDGTTNGTSVLKSVDTEFGIFEFVVFKNLLYFVANDGTSGRELWQSDGTAEGTKLFADLAPGNAGINPSTLKVAGNSLFFIATDTNNGYELWRSEGTPASTQLLKDIRPGAAGSSPYNLRSLNNLLFFLANDGVNGVELWKSDGTTAGTQLVKDIFAGPDSAFRNVSFQSTNSNAYFFFVANDSQLGKGLWRTDGTPQGTLRLKDLVLGANVSGPTELASNQNEAYFVTQDGVNGLELWKTDGTIQGTQILTQLNAKGAGSSPNRLMVLKNQLIFSAKTEAEGFELWKSDGTSSGTQLIKDIFPGSGSSNFALNLIYKDQVFFTAENKLQNRQIWKSDGTSEGTVLLKSFNESGGGSSTEGMAVLKDKLIFNAFRLEEGEELWVSDGTEAGTKLLKDINPNGQSLPFIPFPPVILGDSLLFFQAHDGVTGTELWKTNGTAQGTSLVANIRPVDESPNVYNFHISMMTKVGERMFFAADDNLNGKELWITDGTGVGTRLVKDIAPGLNSSNPNNGLTFKGQLFFMANDRSRGFELWKSDGTETGTVLVKDIAIGSTSAFPGGFTIHNNELYFVVNEAGPENNGLWKTDGSQEGTIRVAPALGDTLSFSRQPFSFGSYLYFSSDDGVHGQELWRSDGTAQGTIMLVDLNNGSASSEPEFFTPYKKDLYFSADDGLHGRELWRLLSDNVVSTKETGFAEILIFPNPATDLLTIRKTEENKNLQIRLHDAQGKVVINSTLIRDTSTDFNVGNLSAGVYVLEILEAGTTKKFSKKIVIVR